MAKTENTKKVPAALVAAVVVIIAICAFVPTVYLPYKNKKPTMDQAHQEALDTIAFYDESIVGQAGIEADIKDLQAQWDKYQKDMFVNHQTALADINKAIVDRDITLVSIQTGTPTADESGTVTAEGNPLYFMTIALNIESDRDQLLSFLRFVEEESVGCYYVQSLNVAPVDVYDSDGTVTGTALGSNMMIYLYYFNQDVVVAPQVDEAEAEAAG